jgi:hypothetical protein
MYNSGFRTHLSMEKQMLRISLDRNSEFMGMYRDSLCYGQMKMLHGKTETALAAIDTLQKQLLAESDGPAPVALAAANVNMTDVEIYHPASRRSYAPLPEGSLIMPGSAPRNELEKIMSDYLSYVTSLTADKDSGRFRLLLDTSAYLPSAPGRHILFSSLHSLEVLKTNIVAVEAAILKTLSGNGKSL